MMISRWENEVDKDIQWEAGLRRHPHFQHPYIRLVSVCIEYLKGTKQKTPGLAFGQGREKPRACSAAAVFL